MKCEIEVDIRALQQKCLEMMDAFDAMCRARGLRYYMSCGTMLGAVRHKGFIPWDDDVDLYMLRDDYDRLVEHAKEWMPAPLKIVTCDTDITFPHFFGKIEDESTTMIERVYLGHFGGVWIDIFPVDGITRNKFMQALHIRRFKFWRHMLYFVYRDPWKHGRNIGGLAISLLQRLISKEKAHRKLQNVIRKYPVEGNDLFMTHNSTRKAFPAGVLGSPTEYEFEGRKYFGVEHYDEYLTIMYDDYMTPPPPEKRVIHHKLVCLDLNRSYKEYMKEHGIAEVAK